MSNGGPSRVGGLKRAANQDTDTTRIRNPGGKSNNNKQMLQELQRSASRTALLRTTTQPISDLLDSDSTGRKELGELPPKHRRETTKPQWTDIDAPVADNPQMVAEYAATIFQNLSISERKHRPSVTYLDTVQKDLTSRMRAVLVDWLVEVAEEYRLRSDTLFLTVALIDRYLSVRTVSRNKLQLVGITCMMVAAKYEEIHVPPIKDFCYITDFTYSKEQVVDMETDLLAVLKFELTQPTAKTFLRRFIMATELGRVEEHARLDSLTRYLIELAMLDYNLLQFLPSQIAAAAVFLALVTLHDDRVWSPTLRHYTGIEAEEVADCVRGLHSLHLTSWYLALNQPNFLPAIREKYSGDRLMRVSAIPPREVLPAHLFVSP